MKLDVDFLPCLITLWGGGDAPKVTQGEKFTNRGGVKK